MRVGSAWRGQITKSSRNTPAFTHWHRQNGSLPQQGGKHSSFALSRDFTAIPFFHGHMAVRPPYTFFVGVQGASDSRWVRAAVSWRADGKLTSTRTYGSRQVVHQRQSLQTQRRYRASCDATTFPRSSSSSWSWRKDLRAITR